jgi:hypothetical protein
MALQFQAPPESQRSSALSSLYIRYGRKDCSNVHRLTPPHELSAMTKTITCGVVKPDLYYEFGSSWLPTPAALGTPPARAAGHLARESGGPRNFSSLRVSVAAPPPWSSR